MGPVLVVEGESASTLTVEREVEGWWLDGLDELEVEGR